MESEPRVGAAVPVAEIYVTEGAEGQSALKRAKDSHWRESLHAAAAIMKGGERSWISAAVSLSSISIGPRTWGTITFACTIFVHVLPVGATVKIVYREKRLGQAGVNLGINFPTIALIIL